MLENEEEKGKGFGMDGEYRIVDCSDLIAKDPFCYVDGSHIQIGDEVCVVDDVAKVVECRGFGIGRMGPYIDFDDNVLYLSWIEDDGILFYRPVRDADGDIVEVGTSVVFGGEEYVVTDVDPVTQSLFVEKKVSMRVRGQDVKCS